MESQLFVGKARIRARDIREQLKNKVSPEVLVVLEAIAEQASTQREQINSLADLINKLQDVVLECQHVLHIATGKLNKLSPIDAQKLVSDTASQRIKVMGEDEARER